MTDTKYGDYSRMLRLPEIRMLGVTCQRTYLAQGEERIIDRTGMTCFYYLLSGTARFYADAAKDDFLTVAAGTSIGLEDGRYHKWVVPHSDGHPSERSADMLLSHVDRRHTIIQKLTNALIVMPRDAEPFATIVQHCVESMLIDMERSQPGDAVLRRLSEIIQLELLHYADACLEKVGPLPDNVRRDAALLRAWTAFLADPGKRWTIASMAAVAGISRTAFFTRFSRAMDASPVEMIRQIRMRYAADMLRSSQAPISEIALRVGYSSDIALIRAFRQEIGTTPARWRTTKAQALP